MTTVLQLSEPDLHVPTCWPTLEPGRVPQSVDWSDWSLSTNARKASSMLPSKRQVDDADPRTRLPATPLHALARNWMRELPLQVRPGLTAQRHPHVINRLALAWADPELLHACFNELFLSDRMNRRGFSIDVLSELLALQTYSAEPRRR